MHTCFSGPSDWRGIDYRGVQTIHGLHAVDGFMGSVCVDAHVPVSESLAPADALLSVLLGRAGIFVLLGLFLGLMASRWLAAPVFRLAASARALQDGDFESSDPDRRALRGPCARSLACHHGARARRDGRP